MTQRKKPTTRSDSKKREADDEQKEGDEKENDSIGLLERHPGWDAPFWEDSVFAQRGIAGRYTFRKGTRT